MRRNVQSGLTLIELLVVLAILALTASVVVLNAPPSRQTARVEAERFAARLDAAMASSLTTGAPLRLATTPAGYRFERYADGGWNAQEGEGPMAPRALPREVALAFETQDAAFANAAPDEAGKAEAPRRLTIDPVGVGDAFAAVFSDGEQIWRVEIDHAGTITVTRDDRS
ncbi:prepilin-type N-terminal cleavage/methylation domain-containing protein [Amphiplicatus metriothermophilus]|uniref:General secretion pathway protein H n=1 Tax=Amphiplicatus metriothermophilus TaxID=1519374 RepID=A0A239PPM7_9PROT|nr:GspH/FimT family pseudopilin [Amphiplicatus metriothermophilus]MBB5518757.1 general secretion pathway protein H [Amphiplicatus metriothermophilus]SNT72088.1 general secretion pathway protein H [Amphiplicatus metriothermophilus]